MVNPSLALKASAQKWHGISTHILPAKQVPEVILDTFTIKTKIVFCVKTHMHTYTQAWGIQRENSDNPYSKKSSL